jgi:hypothetical protein
VLARLLLPFAFMIGCAAILPFVVSPILSAVVLFAGTVVVTGGIFLTASDRQSIRNRIFS